MVSRRKRSNSSVGNKLNNLTDKVTEQQKLQQVSGTQTNAVTNDSIAIGAVNTESVADRSITSNKIGRGEVTSDNLGVINEIVASGGLDIETGVDGHLSLSGGKYEAPYDGIEDANGYKILAFDPADNTVKVIDNTPVVTLDNIDDVVVTGATNDQILSYDEGTDTWGPVTATIDYLSDVTITSASVGQGLAYNSSGVWVNSNPPSYNYIINGAFDIWQRGTSFASATSNTYSADRWRAAFDGTGVRTISQQAFTLGTAPVSGYEGRFFYRYNQTTAGTGATFSNILEQRIESVRTVAGETITISFWAKADATRTVTPIMTQYFGTGGSPSASTTTNGSAKTLTTSWANYTATVTLPSLSGKTIGTDGNDSIILTLQSSTGNATQTIDIWGVQVEEGSIATPFRRNAPSIQAELEACKRYYETFSAGTVLAPGYANTSSVGRFILNYAEKRALPAVSASGGASTFAVSRNGTDPVISSTAISFTVGSTKHCVVLATTSAALTAGTGLYLYATGAGNIALDSEL